jgi:hypothetical protein
MKLFETFARAFIAMLGVGVVLGFLGFEGGGPALLIFGVIGFMFFFFRRVK